MKKGVKPKRLYQVVSHQVLTAPCGCGCGKIPKGTRRPGGRVREYFDATCRKRAARARAIAEASKKGKRVKVR